MTSIAYIGLGSNLEQPEAQVTQALAELAQLPGTRVTGRSGLYASIAVGPPQPDYINAVARLDTELPPLDLLDALQQLEQQHRRVRREHWGPRTLDLDLLLYGEQVIDLPRLQVPHPHMTERNFVLYPLAELAPDLVLPNGQALAELVHRCPAQGLRPLNQATDTQGVSRGRRV